MNLQRSSCAGVVFHPVTKFSLLLVPWHDLPQLLVKGEVVVRLGGGHWQFAPDIQELLSHSSDVIRLKPTAASDDPDPDFVGLAGPLPGLPPGDLAGLHSEGELWDLNPTKGPGVRSSVAIRLGHPDSALAHRDPILIPTRSHTHGGRHGQVELLGHLYGPLHLNDVAEILAEYQLNIILLINRHRRPELSLDL